MSEHGIEEVKKHVRVYISVFAALAVLTVVTVAVSYLDLSTSNAIAVALLIATVKASLVALYFMHLITERRTILGILGLTFIFFVVCLYVPTTWTQTEVESHSVWDSVEIQRSDDGGHGDGHTDGDHH